MAGFLKLPLTSDSYEYILIIEGAGRTLKIKNKLITTMPRLNGTGPQGLGPGTGWGMGPCTLPAGRQGAGRGWGRGFGGGFGRFWRFGSQITEKEEKEILKEEAGILETDLRSIKDRLAELDAKK